MIVAIMSLIIGLTFWFYSLDLKYDKKKCQCPFDSEKTNFPELYDSDVELPFQQHRANECKCTNNLRWYWRDKKLILLCSNCYLSSDIKDYSQGMEDIEG